MIFRAQELGRADFLQGNKNLATNWHELVPTLNLWTRQLKIGSITQKKVILPEDLNLYKFQSIGVLECWSIGVLAEGLMTSFYTPVLQHSNTPRWKLFNKFLQS